MKKENILKALQDAGVEIAEDKMGDFLRELHKLNDEDITNVKSKSQKEIDELKEKQTTLESEIAQLKETHANELKSKDEELSQFNAEEIAELKQYKEDNEAKIKAGKEQDSLKAFLGDNKFSIDDVLMSYVNDKLKPVFDDEFKITNSEELLVGLNEKASQYKITETEGGAKPQLAKSKPEQVDDFESGFDEAFGK